MSRRLIICGADFSANGMVNYNGITMKDALGLNATDFSRASTTTQNYYFPSPSYQCPLVAGKTIYGIKVKTVSNGNFQFLQMTGYSGDPTVNVKNTGTITVLGTYRGIANKVKTILFDTPIVVPNDGNVCFGIRPAGSALNFLNSQPPSIYYLTSISGKWAFTANFGGGFELLVEE